MKMMGTVTEQSLADLIRQAHDAGLSYREMADRARRAGHEISHTQLSDYAQRKVVKPPHERMLRAVAAAIGTTYEQARAAMMREFYGYTPRELRNSGGSRAAAMIPPDLSPEEERDLARAIEFWLASRSRDDQ